MHFHIFTRKNLIICAIALLLVVFLMYGPKKTQVLCVGDSLTYGSGVLKTRETDCYPAQLQELLGNSYKVSNYGLRNATASYVSDLPYVESSEYKASIKKKADIVIIMLGANDSKTYNWNEENYIEGLTNIVKSYQSMPTRPRIILVRPPYTYSQDGSNVAAFEIQPKIGSDLYGVLVPQVANETGVEYLDMYAVTEGKTELYTDGIHFNKAGYALIAETIYEIFE